MTPAGDESPGFRERPVGAILVAPRESRPQRLTPLPAAPIFYEYFDYPDYIGRFGIYTRWKLYGLDLPEEVMQKVYRENALHVIPRLL